MLTPRKIAGYGWRPDLGDQRDLLFSVVHAPPPAPLPTSVSLADKMPPVYDQGQLGSCTANALAAAYGFLHPGYLGSRLQLYYDERLIEGDVAQDGGAQIRDGVKVLNKTGLGPESEWPYDPAKFAHKPPVRELRDAAKAKISSYSRLLTQQDFMSCLADGFPLVFGFTVYESFESEAVAKSGVVPMPGKREQVVGGHAVCAIGYDTTRADGPHYKVRNSWGSAWGQDGDFWMPAAYLENSRLASDAWTLRK